LLRRSEPKGHSVADRDSLQLSDVSIAGTQLFDPFASLNHTDAPISVAAGGASPRILFVALVNNVGCERVMIEMANHGAQCALMSPPNYYCTKVRPLARHFALPNFASVWLVSLFVRRRLAAAVRKWCPTFIVPLDDVAAWLLRGLATA